MQDPILQYRAALSYNREVFLAQQPALLKAFSAIDANFDPLVDLLATMRDARRRSHVSLVPFILLLQRQARAAFELFSVDQSYQGWLLARPGIEAALIIGKWVDDPEDARLWQNRVSQRSAYTKAYSGKALRSQSLKCSDRIQGVLSRVNDDFVHANIDYYGRHLQAAPGEAGYVNVVLGYFDDDSVQEAHVLAFLHLIVLVQDGLAKLFAGLFGRPVALPNTIESFKATFAARAATLTKTCPEAATILNDLGGWSQAV